MIDSVDEEEGRRDLENTKEQEALVVNRTLVHASDISDHSLNALKKQQK